MGLRTSHFSIPFYSTLHFTLGTMLNLGFEILGLLIGLVILFFQCWPGYLGVSITILCAESPVRNFRDCNCSMCCASVLLAKPCMASFVYWTLHVIFWQSWLFFSSIPGIMYATWWTTYSLKCSVLWNEMMMKDNSLLCMQLKETDQYDMNIMFLWSLLVTIPV